MASSPKKKLSRKQAARLDLRKQLFNDCCVGPIEKIQVSTERIVALRGILFDLDPDHFRAGPLFAAVPAHPEEFYRQIVQPMLERHPTLAKCEVRMTGTGLHAILWFDEPVLIETDGERQRWAAIVQVVQAALPIDPDQPGITATTRAIGSVNSKNRRRVVRLEQGSPVTRQEVLDLFEQMCSQPFRTVMQILSGTDKISPCPVCGATEATLSASDHVGNCYGSCGKVKLDTLFNLVLAPRPAVANRGPHNA